MTLGELHNGQKFKFSQEEFTWLATDSCSSEGFRYYVDPDDGELLADEPDNTPVLTVD